MPPRRPVGDPRGHDEAVVEVVGYWVDRGFRAAAPDNMRRDDSATRSATEELPREREQRQPGRVRRDHCHPPGRRSRDRRLAWREARRGRDRPAWTRQSRRTQSGPRARWQAACQFDAPAGSARSRCRLSMLTAADGERRSKPSAGAGLFFMVGNRPPRRGARQAARHGRANATPALSKVSAWRIGRAGWWLAGAARVPPADRRERRHGRNIARGHALEFRQGTRGKPSSGDSHGRRCRTTSIEEPESRR